MPRPAGIAFFTRVLAFTCFVLSGAASISYEMIWLRQAMTYFGVITPVISSVLSIFMAGLALGTWIAGRLTSRIAPDVSLKYYAVIELLVGLYALAVPAFFKAGYSWLLDIGTEQSRAYLFYSWAIISAILLPVCTFIGCTFPLLMHYLRRVEIGENNFGFLYCANLLGGVVGCVLPLGLIELYGFQKSLAITAGLNVTVCLLALVMGWRFRSKTATPENNAVSASYTPVPLFLACALFLFGLATMGCEVIWMRAYLAVIGPTVYTFGLILLAYLLFTALGTNYFLLCSRKGARHRDEWIVLLLPASALLPAMCNVILSGVASLAGMCFCLGYLTPMIVDKVALNDARKASIAYLYNFAGCILGPLFTTYILFFYAGIKGTLIFYAAVLLVVSLFFLRSRTTWQFAAAALFAVILYPTLHKENIEDYVIHNGQLERDYVGSIGAIGKGMDRDLMVNGIAMTHLTTTTKFMAYLPLAYHPHPKSALTICFGMGTTLRSLTFWPLEKIVVAELSEGVPKLFPYFHEDAPQILADSRVEVVVDDGRRYLNRTHEQFDVITIDPPPPITASGSGLLYSTEFIGLVKKKLAPGGVMAHWIWPHNAHKLDKVFLNAAVNAMKRNFKYVRIYNAFIPFSGVHVLASDSPLPLMDAQEFIRRLPPRAAADLVEWEKGQTLQQLASATLTEVDEHKLLPPELSGVYMSDDRLYNEFYILRLLGWFDPSHHSIPVEN